ncbi:MAG: DsrE/DsrF/DrsH-like family protein [Thermoanaerobaculia bacterium]
MTTSTATEPTSVPQVIPAESAPGPKPIEALSIIVSKASLDEVYPALILANAARMSGIGASLFFTFWGLDAINKKKIDRLHVATVGNPSMAIPTMVGGLPGMESLATEMMKKKMEKLDIPPAREMIEILHDSGAKIYACRLAMDMFQLERDDLVEEVDEVISAMDFFDKAAGAQILFI